MAAQQVPAAVLNDKEKAIFEGLKSAALAKKASKAKVVDDVHLEVVTFGFIKNNNKEEKALQIIDQHDWAGSPVKPYPQVIPFDQDLAEFEHRGPIPQGSRGAVVYADGSDTTARKWLVAFDNPQKKVYVEAGPTGPVDWNVIEHQLNASEDFSTYHDPILGGKAAAMNNGYEMVVFFFN